VQDDTAGVRTHKIARKIKRFGIGSDLNVLVRLAQGEGFCQNSRHEGEAVDVNHSDLVYKGSGHFHVKIYAKL
jgi:hypothetical protein